MEKTDVKVSEEDGTQTEADPEDYPHAFGLPEDPPTPGPKESNNEAVVTDKEVEKATGKDPVTGQVDPTALSRDDDITVEPEHWAEGHYYRDMTGMTERTERVPDDNFTTDREEDGTVVPVEGETDDAHADAPPVTDVNEPPPAPDEPPPPDTPVEEPPADEPPPEEAPA